MNYKKFREEQLHYRRKIKNFSAIFIFLLFVTSLISLYFTTPAPLFIGIALALIVYYNVISIPFRKVKHSFKEHQLSLLMQTYYPELRYQYFPKGKKAKQIINDSKLITANGFDEEDVIQGDYNGKNFYFSEVKATQTTGNSQVVKFDGSIIKINIPNAHYPTTILKSTQSFWENLFNKSNKVDGYELYYETENESIFKNTFKDLFPFIHHMSKNNKKVLIKAEKDTILVMMHNNKTDFLDSPSLDTHNDFEEKAFNLEALRQLNSLVYIVETFGEGCSSLELEEKLELLTLLELEKVEMIEKK